MLTSFGRSTIRAPSLTLSSMRIKLELLTTPVMLIEVNSSVVVFCCTHRVNTIRSSGHPHSTMSVRWRWSIGRTSTRTSCARRCATKSVSHPRRWTRVPVCLFCESPVGLQPLSARAYEVR
jgi:hypothetical protein